MPGPCGVDHRQFLSFVSKICSVPASDAGVPRTPLTSSAVTSEHTLTFELADTVVVVTSAVVGAAVVGAAVVGASVVGASVAAGLARGRWGRWGLYGLYGLYGRSRCVAGVVGVPDFALLPHAAE